ncbi:putative o-succinylbenzoate--CoA ligase [Helianthus annuus]|nr:putative o-succinylbenzoate--CoA ligase [Helianthus annuus]
MLKMPFPRPHSFNYTSNRNGVAIVCFTSGIWFWIMVFVLSHMHKLIKCISLLGTTGKPKGVMLSHSALIVQSLAKIATVGYNEDDVYMHTAPLGHVGGLSLALTMLMVGGCHVLMPKFELKLALEAIEEYRVTSLITVPTIMSDIISLIRTKYTRKELPTVNKILNGGGSLSNKQIKDATDIFPNAGLFTAYGRFILPFLSFFMSSKLYFIFNFFFVLKGMTEGCSSLTFMTLKDPTKQITVEKKLDVENEQEGVCVGKSTPHVELKIRTEDSTHVGQILTRGAHLMIGYWDQIQKKENHCNEGWHETGDIGNLWLIGRMKGRIKSGGENIYPEDVSITKLRKLI